MLNRGWPHELPFRANGGPSTSIRFELRSQFWNADGRIRKQVALLDTPTGDVERHDFVVVVLNGDGGIAGERTYSSPAFARLTLGDYYDQLGPC